MKKIIATIVVAFAVVSCASVDITKTGKGYFPPVNPASVEILKTRPERAYTEIGTMDVSGFSVKETAKMHNAIRSKAGPLGADAVIITDENVFSDGWTMQKFASGVAIQYK